MPLYLDGTLQEKLKPVFLYQVMAATKSGASVPVGQMVSAKHDHLTISRWLEDLFKATSIPKEVVLDESAALLLAVVKAFTQFDNLVSYLQRCHHILENSSYELPKSYLRHDISHMVKTIKRARIFDSIGKKQSEFYQYCIGILFKIDNFEDMLSIIEDILTMAIFEFESFEITEPARKRLQILIETHAVQEIYRKIKLHEKVKSDESHIIEIDTTDLSTTITWYENIKTKLLMIDNTNNEGKVNFYCSSAFIKYFDHLIFKMPLWGAIMTNYFNSPNKNVSSSNCESDFKYVKRFLFQNEKKMRIDKFVFTHIDDIIGRITLAIADLNTLKIKTKRAEKRIFDIKDSPNHDGKLIIILDHVYVIKCFNFIYR